MNGFKNTRIATLALTIAVVGAAVLTEGCARRVESKSNPSTDEAKPQLSRLERGKYLAEGVMHCFQCHSDLDWKANGTPVPGRKGAGHDWKDYGVPFPLVAPNLTPDRETGTGKWTDETFARAIREGKGHDGRTLFPLMPYMKFRSLSDEDLASVITYIRSLEPVRNKLRKTALPDEIKGVLPPHQPITEPVPEPDMSDPVKRGAYLVQIGNCTECHTPRDEKDQPIAGLDFGGGSVLEGPWGRVASANITSDPTGISYYDEAQFIKTIRTGQVGARKLKPIMPWSYLRNMNDEDLKAIFAYLRTVKPVRHTVDNTEQPELCKICGQRHGFGDRNE
jgi:mono/diheme cytochrome c family protein